MAADASNPLSETRTGYLYNDPSSRVFLDTLQQRRLDVFKHMTQLEESDSIAAFVFDLFTRLAQSNKKRIDGSTIHKLNEQLGRFDVPLSEVRISLLEGMVLSLEHALTLGAPPPSTHEIINALFAHGYSLYLEAKPTSERRNFTSRVVKLLPGVERLGPFLLSDFIDFSCTEEDALSFWQLYVERVASELGRRTSESETEPETWTLSPLLYLHDIGPSALVGRRWEVLRRHIDRIIQCNQHEWRWRFLRVLVEACQDEKVLYFLLSSPAVMEDREIPFLFLTRGNSKLKSCALFLMHTTRMHRKMLNKILEYFDDRTLIEIGDRLVEIYAQTQLFSHPSRAIEVLKGGIISIVEYKLREEPVDALLNSINNDARAFRQNLLLTDVIPKDRHATNPSQLQLLERVLQSFFHSFTPSGVRHPLNDKTYQLGIVRAIIELMRVRDNNHAANLKSFGLSLNKAASRWLPDEDDSAKRKLLLSYFIGIYAYVLRLAAQQLYAKYETQSRAMELYRILIELYISEPAQSFESGGYGPLNPLMATLYPELISPEHMNEPAASRIEEASVLLARVEAEQFQSDDFSSLLSEWKDRNRGRNLVEAPDEELTDDKVKAKSSEAKDLAIETKGHVQIITHYLVSVFVVFLSTHRTAPQSALRSYMGLDMLSYLMQRTLHFLGIRRYGELSLAGEQVLFQERHTHKSGHDLSAKEIRFHTSQISGVSVHQPLRGFYYILGIFALLTFTFAGGHFLFAGVRGAEMGLGLLGLSLIGVGFVFDAAMGSLQRSGSRQITLELSRHNNPKPLTVGIDRTHRTGQALLNAFMAQQAQRREEDFNQGWTEIASRNTEHTLNSAAKTEDENQKDEDHSAEGEMSEDKSLSSDPDETKKRVDENQEDLEKDELIPQLVSTNPKAVMAALDIVRTSEPQIAQTGQQGDEGEDTGEGTGENLGEDKGEDLQFSTSIGEVENL